jgi:hypothetical protein
VNRNARYLSVAAASALYCLAYNLGFFPSGEMQQTQQPQPTVIESKPQRHQPQQQPLLQPILTG